MKYFLFLTLCDQSMASVTLITTLEELVPSLSDSNKESLFLEPMLAVTARLTSVSTVVSRPAVGALLRVPEVRMVRVGEGW